MAFVRFMINLWKSAWNIVSDIRIDGVSWTTIVVALFVFCIIVGGLLSARR